jgi:hypothetical protein
LTITIPPASLLTDFDQLDIAEAIRNAVAHDATSLTARDRRALTLLTYVPGLHGGTRALAHVLAEDRVALPLPTDLAMALLDVIGNDDLLGPEPEWPAQEAWLAARKPTSTTGEVMTLMATDKPARGTASAINSELSAAVAGRLNWSLHYLGTPALKAMYAPSDDVRGFIFPSHDEDGWGGWTWFVLRDGRGCVRHEGGLEATADKTARLLEEFVADLSDA